MLKFLVIFLDNFNTHLDGDTTLHIQKEKNRSIDCFKLKEEVGGEGERSGEMGQRYWLNFLVQTILVWSDLTGEAFC